MLSPDLWGLVWLFPPGFRLKVTNTRLLGYYFPTFGFRLRRAFLDTNAITDSELFGLIMGPIAFGLSDRLLQNRMLKAALD
jgi:hypothetical protein